ncbi:UNVERIFIED_CONTAM: hypothetical protein Sradi_1702500 [Sesamum radiatum]|uniref:Uncharacterized protein n=1 Tax=Sesamum radiatum TaxID=300843 RepID=A0AAW2TVP7_SESRA
MPHPWSCHQNLLGAIQQMITSAIREQPTVLVSVRVTTSSKMVTLERADPALAVPRPHNIESPTTQLPAQVGDVPPQWLAPLECLQKELQNVQYQVMGAPYEE